MKARSASRKSPSAECWMLLNSQMKQEKADSEEQNVSGDLRHWIGGAGHSPPLNHYDYVALHPNSTNRPPSTSLKKRSIFLSRTRFYFACINTNLASLALVRFVFILRATKCKQSLAINGYRFVRFYSKPK